MSFFGSNLNVFRIFSRNQSLFRRGKILMKSSCARAHILEDLVETNDIPSFPAANRSRDRGWMEWWSLEPRRNREGGRDHPPRIRPSHSFPLICSSTRPTFVVLLTNPSTQLESHLLPVINPLLPPNPSFAHLSVRQVVFLPGRRIALRHTTAGFPINNAFPGL